MSDSNKAHAPSDASKSWNVQSGHQQPNQTGYGTGNVEVKLQCAHCNTAIEPRLERNPTTNALGAWCPQCNEFIKWVKQNTLWLNLEKRQTR